MAMVRPRGPKFELRVKHKLLPKVFTATFDTEQEAWNYGHTLESLLSRGVVPEEMRASKRVGESPTVATLIREYLMAVPASDLDGEVLGLLGRDAALAATRMDQVLQYRWVEGWIRSLKVEKNLAPGTIRKRVGAMARMLDWRLRRDTETGTQPLANPFRLLPKNYSTYNEHERREIASDPTKKAKVDTERERRLAPDEEARIVAAMRGEKREDRERPLEVPEGDALVELFLLIVNTGLRLREAYTLRVEQINLEYRTIHIEKTKTGATRDVPILPDLYDMLSRRVAAAKLAGTTCRALFPWWNGTTDKKELARITSRLSRAFSRAFEYAKCENLTEHDLRHEATCRWILLRDDAGRWMFRTEEAMRITGHKDPRMFMRYVSLRGSDLADRLWIAQPVAQRA
ncbi:hypothetical protein R6138_01878 [Ralstonia thomasii]|uniref:site-specific integrase n=1 Tax=Ralstonia thomasii TaxID=3058596 RepID=UPI0028F676C0|nr:site-specific integrase [Ralstonia sp. LMG 18095]CAJ0872866.1 hypothetical protein R6138_01878 [Ralstonia sp. LMG 18095]